MSEYKYRPYEERTALEQYKALLKDILENGKDNPCAMVDGNTGEPLYTKERLGVVTRFDVLKDGAPIITERDISGFYKSAIGELFAFINGARTQEELEQFGCKWWKSWLTEKKCAKRGLETGDLGPGSYGAAFHDFPTKDGESFNQFAEIIKQMKERPELKTHLITPWIPNYTIRNQDHTQKVVVCPCHGWIHFNIIDDKLNMTMYQRSCDTVVGLPSNWAQYTALLLAMSNVMGLEPGEFVHMISNAHIYSNTFETAETILSREAAPFPTLKVVNNHDSIFDYRKDDFALEDYHPKEKILKIPIGV
jgi:thymidylate synthase